MRSRHPKSFAAPAPPTAVIGHRYPLIVAAVAAEAAAAGVRVVAATSDGDAARAAIADLRPSLALLGWQLGTTGALDVLRDRRGSDAVRIALLCDDLTPAPLVTAIAMGVDGLLLATAPVASVGACLAAVVAGERWLDPAIAAAVAGAVAPPTLTRRERDVARLVAAGQRNRTIAGALGISEGTVKMHLHNVYAKLGLESRTQLATDARVRAV